MSMEFDIDDLSRKGAQLSGTDLPFYNQDVKQFVIPAFTRDFLQEYQGLAVGKQAAILENYVIPKILAYVRSTALYEFGERNTHANPINLIEGFVTFLKVDQFTDELLVALYQAVDADGYAQHIQGAQNSISMLDTFFREYEAGSISSQSFGYIKQYYDIAEKRIGSWRKMELSGIHQEEIVQRVRAYDMAMPGMRHALLHLATWVSKT